MNSDYPIVSSPFQLLSYVSSWAYTWSANILHAYVPSHYRVGIFSLVTLRRSAYDLSSSPATMASMFLTTSLLTRHFSETLLPNSFVSLMTHSKILEILLLSRSVKVGYKIIFFLSLSTNLSRRIIKVVKTSSLSLLALAVVTHHPVAFFCSSLNLLVVIISVRL